jgi:hypothetical protein
VLRNCQVVGNTAHGFAGGGIYFNSSEEGMEFHDTMHEAFKFNTPELTVRGGRVADNRATKLAAQGDDHGKGGGIYVLRYKNDPPDLAAVFGNVPVLQDYVAFRADKLTLTLDAVEFAGNRGHVAEPSGSSTPAGDDNLYVAEMIDNRTFKDDALATAAGRSSFSYASVKER